MTPFPLPLFSKEDWMRSNFFCWQFLVFPFSSSPRTRRTAVEWNGRKRPHLHVSVQLRRQEQKEFNHHQRITFRLHSPACTIIVSLKNSSSLLKDFFSGFYRNVRTSLSYIFSPLTYVTSPRTHVSCLWSQLHTCDPYILHIPCCVSTKHFSSFLPANPFFWSSFTCLNRIAFLHIVHIASVIITF